MTTKTKAHTVAARDVAAIIHLIAGHDTNGNPRRGYLLIGRAGYPIGYVDEGYRGEDALADVVRNYRAWSGLTDGGAYTPRKLPWPVSVTTTPGELRDWRGKAWGA